MRKDKLNEECQPWGRRSGSRMEYTIVINKFSSRPHLIVIMDKYMNVIMAREVTTLGKLDL